MKNLKVGDPLDRSTDVGPLAREDLLESLHDQVRRPCLLGPSCLRAASASGGRDSFTRRRCFPQWSLAWPLSTKKRSALPPQLHARQSAEHAVKLANQSPFGLAASVWTADTARGEALAAKIESGAVFINEISKSDPRVPFGGVKRSGYGRELAEFGIREFVNIKTVWIK